MEKRIDHLFHENSYGYRPMKSAHQAIEQVRQNSYSHDWVIDMDISKFFDEIDHELMLKAVGHVISDKWLSKEYPQVSFVRYADDIVIHCNSKEEAEKVLQAIRERLKEVKLQIKEEKTRITYCKDYRRKEKHEAVKFEFLGFSYQPRARIRRTDGKYFMAFTAEISQSNQKKIREVIRGLKQWQNTTIEAKAIAQALNVKLRGWINYYGKYSKRSLRNALITIDRKLIKWLMQKYKIRIRKSVEKLKALRQTEPNLFYHWQMGYC